MQKRKKPEKTGAIRLCLWYDYSVKLFFEEVDRMYIDLHTHSEYSFDSQSKLADMIAAAVENGVDVLAVTDHCELDRVERDDLMHTMPASADNIRSMQKDAPIKLLCGIEVGQAVWDTETAEKILSMRTYDMVIGSVHCIRQRGDFYDMNADSFSDAVFLEAMTQYYDELLELANWGKFDTLAHLTYPYRYCDLDKRGGLSFADRFDGKVKELFAILVKNGKALEFNTKSYRHEDGTELRLFKKYLRMFKEAGGEYLTFGSDAHTPDRIGMYMEKAIPVIKASGFDAVTYFENRRPVKVKL